MECDECGSIELSVIFQLEGGALCRACHTEKHEMLTLQEEADLEIFGADNG